MIFLLLFLYQELSDVCERGPKPAHRFSAIEIRQARFFYSNIFEGTNYSCQ